MHYTIALDTNILCNYGQLRHIEWSAMFPDIHSMTIILADKVRKEMDEHKDTSTGYLRKRAKELQLVFGRAEKNKYRTKLEDSKIDVEVIFLDRPHQKHLDQELFDISDADELIVAQYKYAERHFPDFTIISNDANTIVAAHRAGMKVTRPYGIVETRTADEPDELTGANDLVSPKHKNPGDAFQVEFVNGDFDPIFVTGVSGDETFENLINELHLRLSNALPAPDTETLVFAYGGLPENYSVREYIKGLRDLDRYHRECNAFFDFFKETNQPTLEYRLRRLANAGSIDVKLTANVAADDIVVIEALATKNCKIVDIGQLKCGNIWGIWEPIPPKFHHENLVIHEDNCSDCEIVENGSEMPEKMTFTMQAPLPGMTTRSCVYFEPFEGADEVEVLLKAFTRGNAKPTVKKIAVKVNKASLDFVGAMAVIQDRMRLMISEQARILSNMLDGFERSHAELSSKIYEITDDDLAKLVFITKDTLSGKFLTDNSLHRMLADAYALTETPISVEAFFRGRYGAPGLVAVAT